MKGLPRLALALAVVAAPAQDHLATVEGRVIDSFNQLPVAGARVVLLRTDRGTVTFGPDIRRSYSPAWYPDARSVEQSLPVTTGQAGKTEGLDFKIARRRTAAIRRRILGNEALGEVTLSLNNVSRKIGARSFMMLARGNVT